MKPYFPMAIAAGLVVVGLAAAFFITPALAPAHARLENKIADQVAQAEAMLAGYSPTDAELLRRFDPAVTSQPSSASQPSTELNADLRGALERRKNLISDALKVIQAAISERIGDGESGASGDKNVAATRLETMLLVEQAQLLRLEAESHWLGAARVREHVEQNLAAWTDLDTQIRSIQVTLNGQGMLPEHEQAPAAEAPPPVDAVPATAEGEHSRLGSVLGKLLGGGKSAPPAAKAPAVASAAAAPQSQPASAVAKAAPVARPAPPPECTLQMPLDGVIARQTQSPQQRIKDLQLCRAVVEERLTKAQQQADALTPQVQQLHQQIDATKAQADAAQKKMLALEHAGIDATDSNSLPTFTKEYNTASDDYRKALRTLAVLTYGSTEKAPITPEEKEMLPDPPIDIDPALQKEQRGFTALEGDLAVAAALVDSEKKLLTQIDREIDRLAQTQKKLDERVADLEAGKPERYPGRTQQKQALTAAAKDAVAQVVAAYQLEDEAIKAAAQASSAARRAQQAADAVLSEARQKANEYPDSTLYRNQMNDRSMVGHANVLAADADAAEAMVLAQRAGGLERHARMLEHLQPAALDTAALTPQDSGSQAPAAWAVTAQAAVAEADASRNKAIEKAKSASGGYKKVADGDLKLWPLHTQMAAMEYLLANLTSGEEADKHMDNARKDYDLATRDRRDRPEVQPLRAVYEKLAQSK